MNNSIVHTNDNCIGCNKCISVCSAVGACISTLTEDGRARIVVDGKRCVACGSCIDVCRHGAREYQDDTQRFFEDLSRGEKISLLLAPAFKANYPDSYANILGGLKQLGVRRIISVSFGADITTWGYLNYMEKYDFAGGISQPCPAVVSYIERYLPELLPKLFPVQSPLMCAAIYARKELGITDKLAFISPCIAKKLEIEDEHNRGMVQYNVTFDHLMRYVRERNISGPPAHSEIEYGLGSFYPAPGGLGETVRWFLGDSVFIRQIEGEKRLYRYLNNNRDRIAEGETPFLLFDALNCENGCICGTAVDQKKSGTDDALYELLSIREQSKQQDSGGAWSIPDSREERLRRYNERFAALKLEDYIRGYTDRSAQCRCDYPDEYQIDQIFRSMNKLTPESRRIDCNSCGYDSCRQMAMAIYNGFNRKENCIHYEKDLVRKLEQKSTVDSLTGLLNKDAFEQKAKGYLASREPDEACSLLIVDFDDFKTVNDEHGHQVGDEVLRGCGRILRSCFRGHDIIGRIGGDEFMVLLCGAVADVSLMERCGRINALLRMLRAGNAVGFSCSIGIVSDRIGASFEELYRLADDALYEAKAMGKARTVQWYTRRPLLPMLPTVFVMTRDAEKLEALRARLEGRYACISASGTTASLNDISLYKKYLRAVVVDYAMSDFPDGALRDYVGSSPLFSGLKVYDIDGALDGGLQLP
ncbi:MAG: diguanylate cyclase [Oscillospiraceae bacterium]|nr:diguanylate cyclase [Oscillospiraceae bacterium]